MEAKKEIKIQTIENKNQVNKNEVKNNNQKKHVVKDFINSLTPAEKVKMFLGGSAIIVVGVLGLAGIINGKTFKFAYKGASVAIC